MIKSLLKTLASISLLLVVASASWAAPPNVLIVMTDDQGLGDFSFTGNPVLKTPHLDAFARQSVRLTDFHVAPMCTPTRGQLLTGVAALRNGATSVTAGRTFLRPGIATMPEQFAKAGYQTGIFGKWHLGDSYPHRPMDKGFQQCIYHLGWGQLHSTPEFDWPLIDGRYFHNGQEKRFQGHCTDVWFDSAMDWMKQCKQREQPFFCYLPTNAPHAPHIELETYTAPYVSKGPAGFFGMIAHIDERFGDLERFLEKEGLAQNTIVIFMTDNGGTAGVKLFNAGLRAGKTTYYEGGHRVPCWIRWPAGELGEPRDIHVATQNLDLFPTLRELCDVPSPSWADVDALYRGASLVALLRGRETRLPDRKLVVQYGQTPQKHESCVIWNQWRLVKGVELYDVAKDRSQEHDVAATNPDVVQAMRAYYDQWWQGVSDRLDDFVPQTIGAKQQPIVELTSGDWQDIYADNTGFVREAVGGPTGGQWHIEVAEAGEYSFILRRWPQKSKLALGAAYEPSAASPPNKPNIKSRSFPQIARAKLHVGDIKKDVPASSSDTEAAIDIQLPAGRTTLKAWFANEKGEGLCGAFFVTVRKKQMPPAE